MSVFDTILRLGSTAASAAGIPFPKAADSGFSLGKGVSDAVSAAKGVLEPVAEVGKTVSEIASLTPYGARREGKLQGRAQAAYMDQAYPATADFERLGVGQGGSAGFSSRSAEAFADRQQRRQLAVERYKADKSASASVASVIGQMRPDLLSRIGEAFGLPTGHGRSIPEQQISLQKAQLLLNLDQFAFKQVMDRAHLSNDQKRVAMELVKTFADAQDKLWRDPWRALMATFGDLTQEENTVFNALIRSMDAIAPPRRPKMPALPRSRPRVFPVPDDPARGDVLF